MSIPIHLRSAKRTLVVLSALYVISCSQQNLPTATLTPATASGSLEAYLEALDYGADDDNVWQQPSTTRMQKFGEVIDEMLLGKYSSANYKAKSLGYEIVAYTDTDPDPDRKHYILREKATYGAAGFTGGGTYVYYPSGVKAVFQVPHPKSDANTEYQGVETYLHTGGEWLMLSGTRRMSKTTNSPCSGTNRASDVAHQTSALFQVVHEKLSDDDLARVFVQFHGFGSDSLADLQAVTQCNTASTTMMNISEGVEYVSPVDSLMKVLVGKVDAGGIIETCIFGEDTDILGGTTNAQGRYTNGSADACTTSAGSSSERFLHVEQSSNVRSTERATLAEYIRLALVDYFP